MTPEERGHLVALRNLLHGAPTTQGLLAARLRAVDRAIAESFPDDHFNMRGRWWRSMLTQRPPDYYEIAGSILDRLDQRK